MKTRTHIVIVALASLALVGGFASDASAQKVTDVFIGASNDGFGFGIGFGSKRSCGTRGSFGLAVGHGGVGFGASVGHADHVHGSCCGRVWNPGHYKIVRERVRTPGYWKTVCVPAKYRWVRRGCRRVRIIVRPSCSKRIWVNGCSRWVSRRVWVPGFHSYSCGY